MVDDIIDQLSPDSQNQAELRSRLEESGIVTGFETQALCAAGRRTWVAINCRSVRSEDGAPRIEGTVVDVTERRKLETQLIRAQRMESVGQLASGLAHDLNNILLPIQIYPGLLRERIQEASLRDLVDAIETSARRGATIVRQLLTFSRGSQAERTSVKMDGLVNEMLGIIQETFPKDINIHSNLQSAVRTVRGDTNQLHQVLLNLCVNARDAMPNGGDISLSVEDCFVDEEMARANAGAQPGPHVLLKVADTGCGIPPENMDKVFEPFFTTKEIGKGTGLGLSTVLGIVSNHGGFIQVDTAPGQGTRFRVYLPADPSDSPVVAEPSQEPEVRGNGEILLVVDDERAVRHATRVVCERAGYRVIEARNGLDALDRLKEPDCEVAAVISDVLMPRMGGVDFIQRLRQLPGGGPPVLAMTGLSKSPEITRLRALENVPLIEKPFTSTLLLQSVGRLLRQHREAHAVPPQ
jgi:signal transduction histidine kinase/CheY-like chemotaxis protein